MTSPDEALRLAQTPRTDAASLDESEGVTHPELCETYMAWTDYWALRECSRTLERELTASRADCERLREENERLRENCLDESMQKILAMTDDQITALCRLEGHDPKDQATIAEQAAENAILTVDLRAAESALALAQRDAGRYRWLRSWTILNYFALEQQVQTFAEMDAAIDAAMKESAK